MKGRRSPWGRRSGARHAGGLLNKSADNLEGGLDDATIKQFQDGVTADRMAFLDGFTKAFFSADGKLMVSEAQRVHALDIAASAWPKGTLDCIGAFSYTDFRADLAKIKLPTLVIHGDAARRCWPFSPLEAAGASVRYHTMHAPAPVDSSLPALEGRARCTRLPAIDQQPPVNRARCRRASPVGLRYSQNHPVHQTFIGARPSWRRRQ